MDNLVPLDFEVFVAGVKMPATTINITSAFNTVPACTVSMPPDSRLFGIGRQDKVPLQVFLEDTLVSLTDDPEWLLLFDGFVTDFAYESNPMGKAFNITAEAVPGILKDVRLHLMQTVPEYAVASAPTSAIASIQVPNHTELTFPASLFTQGLTPSGVGNTIRVPSDFLENVLCFLANKHTGGSPVQPESPILQFYSEYCERVNMLKRWAKVPHFDTEGLLSWNKKGQESGFPLLKGLQSSKLFELLDGMARSGPMTESIYNLINYVVSSLEYEFAMFASPSFVGDEMVQMCVKPMLYEALPPACNFIFRSHVQDITTHEKVSEYPTRVLFRDLDSPYSKVINDSNMDGITKVLTEYFWPYAGIKEGTTNKSAALLTSPPHDQTEEYCGPRVFESTAPPWMGYLTGGDKGEQKALATVFENYMKHIYYLKKYEHRNMAVSSVFNPYITPGFPGVVYDAMHEIEEGDSPRSPSNLRFVGQVMVVSHTLSKQTASTNVQFGFVRLLEEENTNRIDATIPEISEKVTHHVGPMTDIYSALLGTDKPPIEVEEMLYEGRLTEAQKNPKTAYAYNRRSIMTKRQFVNFYKSSIDSEGNMTGPYFEERHDPELVRNLKSMNWENFNKSVFAK